MLKWDYALSPTWPTFPWLQEKESLSATRPHIFPSDKQALAQNVFHELDTSIRWKTAFFCCIQIVKQTNIDML